MKQATMRRFISIGVLAALVIVFSISSDYFMSSRNIFSILRDASITGIVAVGVTMVIITAGIDLSTGAIIALSCMTMANCYRYTVLPVWLILIVGVMVGCACGLLNGVLITRLKLPEFIATLATMGVFRGLTYITAIRVNGNIVNQPIRDYRFTGLAGELGGLYYVTIVFIALVILGQLVLRKTRFGTYVYATGANRKAAELAGVNTDRVRVAAFAITGLCCGIGALFMCARMQTATCDFGVGLEFDVIAAVVVGGVALSGGSGDVVGSMIGAIFMATLNNGIYKFQISTSYQPIIKGAIIVLVVIFDAWYRRYMNERTQRRRAGEMLAATGGEVSG